MLQIINGSAYDLRGYGKIVYEGKVVNWRPRLAAQHQPIPRAASVQQNTDWIIERAKKFGTCKDLPGKKGTPVERYAVSFATHPDHFDKGDLYARDNLERKVRSQMLLCYEGRPDEVLVGIGSPKAIRMTILGKVVHVGYTHLALEVVHMLRSNGQMLLKPKEPIQLQVKLRKVQQVMLYRSRD